MKVYISKYRDHWISPYTMLDYLFWWTDWSKCARWKLSQNLEDEAAVLRGEKSRYVERPEWTERWSDRLEPISRAIQWVGERIYPRIEFVKIDRWDTWSMDHTLAHIVLPMLRQLQATKHGSPMVDDEDVPEHLRSTAAPAKENEWDIDAKHHDRWDWVMGEMIFAFESLQGGENEDWEQQFFSGKHDWTSVATEFDENGKPKLFRLDKGPNDTVKIDMKGMKAYQKRISNGFRLFGKYYQNLWD